jgi:hypothetical protein
VLEGLDHSRLRLGVQQPYGYLSYGRTPHIPESDQPADRYLRRFHSQLSEDLMQVTTLGPTIPAVYLDQRIPLGSTWQQELKRRLARSQVLVPVLSWRLFDSSWCTLEWECFQRRQQQQRNQGTFIRNAVVPVLWNELRPDDIPRPYSEVQFNHQDLDPDYAKLGLLGLLQHSRFPTFRRVVYQLALEIVRVAACVGLEPCEPSDFDALFDSLNGRAGEEP